MTKSELHALIREVLEEYGYAGSGKAPTDPAGALGHKVNQMYGQLGAPGGLPSEKLKKFVSYLQEMEINIGSIDAETGLIRGPGGRKYSLKRLYGLFQGRERRKPGF